MSLPRLHALVAARAPVAAVFRRGPSAWWHVGRWDLETGALDDAAWADFDHHGRLLVATRTGRLEIRDPDDRALAVVRAHDLVALRPDPTSAPDWARRW